MAELENPYISSTSLSGRGWVVVVVVVVSVQRDTVYRMAEQAADSQERDLPAWHTAPRTQLRSAILELGLNPAQDHRPGKRNCICIDPLHSHSL